MHILVTNDDGITSPGLLALARAVQKLGKVSILAPDRNWSASGHVRTLDRPLRVKKVRLSEAIIAYASDGAPSDCVALATAGFFEEKIDLVVSGINSSANLGHDVTYSGTVTAAMEAAIWGIPALAFSLDTPENGTPLDYSAAGFYAQVITTAALANHLNPPIFLNVNIPGLPRDQIKGIQVTRMGLRVYHDHLDRREDPRGRPYYWTIGSLPTGLPERGTDIGAIADGFVSVTPLQLDLTAYHVLPELKAWFWDLPSERTSAINEDLQRDPSPETP